MSKYPCILFYRHVKYNEIDRFIETNKESFQCTFHITHEKLDLRRLWNPNIHLLITYGENVSEYDTIVNTIIPTRMNRRWLHYTDIQDISLINRSVNYCYIHNIIHPSQPAFSIFTTCYQSYEKILRAYISICKQTCIDWEWVILDDTPDHITDNTPDGKPDHFTFLKEQFNHDTRIRLYKRSANSGNIGNVKNEAVLLCRGLYLLELDHDDEILPHLLKDAQNIFEGDKDVGFVFSDYTNIYENGDNFNYGDHYSLGYAGYYMQKYEGRWVYVSSSPNINNITLSHIVSVPNHPRIWRRSTLLDMGNYNIQLPICDDYELLLRTATRTKMAKIHKLSYVQYMNAGNNNFSLIRNGEINRLTPYHIRPQCYQAYKINERMKELDAYEDEKYIAHASPIWKRDNYIPQYCNIIVNLDYTKIFVILGTTAFYTHLETMKELYTDLKHDFLLLDNTCSKEALCQLLDQHAFDRMKCYSIANASRDELVRYFHMIYKSVENYEIFAG